jgi:ABC-2 type transport system permease protein
MIQAIGDCLIITKRQLLQLVRVPEVIIFATIQPAMFVFLFRYVFGGAIKSGVPGGYVQLLLPGIFVQTVAFTLAGTAVGLAEDMQKGLIDRFRSLPIARSAVVIGRTLGDSTQNIVTLVVMALVGYLVGWRPSASILSIFLAFVFLLAFGFSMSWIGVLIGLSVREVRVAQNLVFISVFPLTFLSNASNSSILCRVESSFNDGCSLSPTIWHTKSFWGNRKLMAQPTSSLDFFVIHGVDCGNFSALERS